MEPQSEYSRNNYEAREEQNRIIEENAELIVHLERNQSIQEQSIEQQNQVFQKPLEKYRVMDSKTNVEYFVNVLAEKHGASTRVAKKIIIAINNKRTNPNNDNIIEWIKDVYDKAEDFGPQEQRAVFNILQQNNWTEKLKEKEKTFNLKNKINKTWKFSKDEILSKGLEASAKAYTWYEKVSKYAKIPTLGLSSVVLYAVKTVGVGAILTLKYKKNDNVVNNKSLAEMIDSFKSQEKKEEAYWVKDNLNRFKENVSERSFKNQQQFMKNVEKLYEKMDFNTKRMLASADPIEVINLMDEAARKVKFKLFDKELKDEKVQEFHYSMMELVIKKLSDNDFRKSIIKQNVEKDRKDIVDVLKVFELEKNNFIVDALTKFNSTIDTYRFELEKARDDLSKVKFALAGNEKGLEYVNKIANKIDQIDNFFMELNKETNGEVFDKYRIVESLLNTHGYKPLKYKYQSKFNDLKVRDLDEIKNHLEYALADKKEGSEALNNLFAKVYNFSPQLTIDVMKNKWEVSLASVQKDIREFKENDSKNIKDYLKQGVSLISGGAYKLAYEATKMLSSIKNQTAKDTINTFCNSILFFVKGVDFLSEAASKTIIEKLPKWFVQCSNKIKGANDKIVFSYGIKDGGVLIKDLNQNDAVFLKSMIIENMKKIEQHKESIKNKEVENKIKGPKL